MDKAIVPVAMIMAHARRNRLAMGVTMVLVMLMLVGMFSTLVCVKVLMPLGQMQPDARRH
jgi:hypothetical protein